MGRRNALKLGGVAALAGVGVGAVASWDREKSNRPYTLRIGAGSVELAPGNVISTTTYNRQFPGPLLRFTEGRPVTVDVHNDTSTPEQLHWHGQRVPAAIDGSSEEGTPFIPAHGMRRLSFIPGPAGFRF
ncbi:multicopper oxidase domain-containing protein [Streptomyces sp. 061-3]|uniref:multicopper oxidase domain-containing protein n=1 Tax=Streptomyces sp. 061-3 TaxID=2789268 RepID=UPI0039811782